ncbi:MAG: hypothetical protein U9N79_11480 [Actinomycetota bacterium]|nr:hypothetical protein [Actinomycetota bacterium]
MNEQNSDNASMGDSIAALQAENEALRSQLEASTPAKTGSGVRRFFAWVLAILAIVLIALAVNVGWAKTTLLDTDAFVATLAPLAEHEAVAEALSIQIGEAVIVATELEASIAEALPAELTFIAGPVATASGNLVATVANELILTDAFATVWSTALRAAHSSVSVLLTGSGAVVAEEGTVGIDIDTIAEPIIVAVADKGLDVRALVGEDFTLGQIVLVESDALGSAQQAVKLLDTLGWLTVLLAIVAIAAALLVGPDRRRQIAILGFGTAIAGVINLVSLRFGRGLTVGAIEDEVNRSAGLAVWDTLVSDLTNTIWALVFLAFVIGLAAWFFGPGPRASRLRTAAGDGVDRWRGQSQEPPTGLSLFFYTWRRPLQWGILGIGLLVLLVMPSVSFAIAVLVVLVGAFLAAVVELIAGPQAVTTANVSDQEPESVDAD